MLVAMSKKQQVAIKFYGVNPSGGNSLVNGSQIHRAKITDTGISSVSSVIFTCILPLSFSDFSYGVERYILPLVYCVYLMEIPFTTRQVYLWLIMKMIPS